MRLRRARGLGAALGGARRLVAPQVVEVQQQRDRHGREEGHPEQEDRVARAQAGAEGEIANLRAPFRARC